METFALNYNLDNRNISYLDLGDLQLLKQLEIEPLPDLSTKEFTTESGKLLFENLCNQIEASQSRREYFFKDLKKINIEKQERKNKQFASFPPKNKKFGYNTRKYKNNDLYIKVKREFIKEVVRESILESQRQILFAHLSAKKIL